MQQETTPRSWLSEGLLLALLPAWAYLTAWAYEYGYSQHFGIPASLVRVDLNTILLLGGIALLWLGTVSMVANYLAGALVTLRKKASWFDLLSALAVIFIALVVTVAIYFASRPIGFVSTIAVVLFVVGTLRQVQGDVTETDSTPIALWRQWAWLYTPPLSEAWRPVVAVTILGVIAMYMCGGAVARTQLAFLIPSTNEALVVLLVHDDEAICARMADGQTERRFRVISMSDPEIVWMVRSVGPLTSRAPSKP